MLITWDETCMTSVILLLKWGPLLSSNNFYSWTETISISSWYPKLMMENWVLLLIAYKLLYMMGSYAAIKVLNTRKWSFVIGVVNTNVHIYKKKHHYSIIQHQHMAAFKKSNPTCMLVKVSYGVLHSHSLSYISYCYRVNTKFLTWMHYCTSFRKKKGNLLHVSDKLTVLLLVLSLHQLLSSYGFFSVSPFCKNILHRPVISWYLLIQF